MKKLTVFVIIILLSFTGISDIKALTLTGGVSMTDSVPQGFFGSWKVFAVRTQTTNSEMFIPYSVEIWNLSKQGSVITLTNPVSGAEASISVTETTSATFTFERTTGDNNEKVVETAKLILQGDNFIGSDTMVVTTYKNGMPIKKENVEYKLKATKLSGEDIRRIFGLVY